MRHDDRSSFTENSISNVLYDILVPGIYKSKFGTERGTSVTDGPGILAFWQKNVVSVTDGKVNKNFVGCK
jgi:hypothetical protein